MYDRCGFVAYPFQWSRDPLIAESRLVMLEAEASFGFQWSRDPLIAESWCSLDASTCEFGFNGAAIL